MGIGRIVKYALGRAMPATVLVKGRRSPHPRIALTFDDGPHRGHTPRILDVLDEHRASATFFLQGSEVEKFPALVREIHARGHQLGNHGHSHLDASRVPRDRYVADVGRAQQVLEDCVGSALDPIFRPPHGRVTGPIFVSLARLGYRFVFWSVDSRDSFIRTASELADHMASIEVTDGDILLFHEDYDHTLDALSEILRRIRERSLAFSLLRSM